MLAMTCHSCRAGLVADTAAACIADIVFKTMNKTMSVARCSALCCVVLCCAGS
jgi:hypothetical protein